MARKKGKGKGTGIMKDMGRRDVKQSKFSVEESKEGKRVTFKGTDRRDSEDLQDRLEEIKEEWRREVRVLREEWKEKVKEWEESLREVQEFIREIKEERRRREEEGIEENSEDSRSRYGDRSYAGSLYGGGSSCRRSRISLAEGSVMSNYSRLSEKEVSRLRKIVVDAERCERKDNIIIKGIMAKDGKVEKEWVKDFLKDKLGVETKILYCRVSGTVIVAKVESEEKKREIMVNKNKLKGENIFIENELTWEERKRQERINKWVKEEKEKGKDVKIGFTKVRINGIWKKWQKRKVGRRWWKAEKEPGEKE